MATTDRARHGRRAPPSADAKRCRASPTSMAATVPIDAPAVRIEDRGLQFADGVYEVIKCLDGRVCDLERHLDRLERSLAALAIPMPTSRARRCNQSSAQTLRRNRLRDALVYLQVDRGVAPRNHLFPVHLHADADRHRPPRQPAQSPGNWQRASALSPCPISAGSAATSSRSTCWPTSWRGSRRRVQDAAKSGSTMRTAA